MVTQVRPYSMFSGINIYRANLGEGLPWHSHDSSHTTMCRRGSCVVRTEGREDIVLTPDSAIKQVTHMAYLMHEIEALEDGTEIVNMFFN
jgi:quercetin dioxygenase-like cupin family protein